MYTYIFFFGLLLLIALVFKINKLDFIFLKFNFINFLLLSQILPSLQHALIF